MGCFAAIRNPAHHLSGDWTPDLALQQLAAFSILVRWVRYWNVIYDPADYMEALRRGTVAVPVRLAVSTYRVGYEYYEESLLRRALRAFCGCGERDILPVTALSRRDAK